MDRKPKLIWGAKAIGETIGVKQRKAFYLLQNDRIPAKKIGEEWVAEENQLIEFLTAFKAEAT